jgi:hypothetical protein
MALTLPTATRNAMCNACVDLLDVGTGTTGGTIKLYTSGDAILVTLTFSATAFGAASTGVATAAAITNGTAVDTGTAAKASLLDRDATVVISGLVVGAGSGDINLNSTSITTGDVVSITSMTVTQPAS